VRVVKTIIRGDELDLNQEGPDIYHAKPILIAVSNGNLKVVKMVDDPNRNMTRCTGLITGLCTKALETAIANNDLDMVQYLLKLSITLPEPFTAWMDGISDRKNCERKRRNGGSMNPTGIIGRQCNMDLG
jgi:hypothetical protein